VGTGFIFWKLEYMTKRILVILGHHTKDSLCGALAQSYVQGAMSSGYEVRQIAIGDLSFEPVIRDTSEKMLELEQDLVKAQNAIQWAQHIVFVYPTWWGGPSALLKGFIDRVFLPDFAFRFREGSSLWDQLLTGRTARLIVTMDTPHWYYRWFFRMPGHNLMKRTILEFCGIKPVSVTGLGPVRTSSLQKREKWLAQVEGYGRDGV
jgi:putative NADPH-quinone reductase